MVEISKHLFDSTCRDLDCNVILHPWSPTCWKAVLPTAKHALIGSFRFYSFVYMVQLLMRITSLKKKKVWMKMLNYYLRSSVMGAIIAASCINISCFLRWLNGGKFSYYGYFLIPSTINAVLIYIEPPSRRGLVINLFSNLLIEYWLRTFQRDGFISLTKTKQTIAFMIGSSLLFYLMRLEGDKKKRTPTFWLFTPERVRRKTDDSPNVCPHEGSCGKHILKGTSIYFAVGLAISLAKLILPRMASPVKALSLIRAKHFNMALFFGSYIGIYKTVICLLCRKRGFDSELYALPAGYLAGLSYLFNPSLGFAIGSVTTVFKLFSTILYDKKILTDKIPLSILLYCYCQGSLFNARLLHPEVCPRYMMTLMEGCSNKQSKLTFEGVQKSVQAFLS